MPNQISFANKNEDKQNVNFIEKYLLAFVFK